MNSEAPQYLRPSELQVALASLAASPRQVLAGGTDLYASGTPMPQRLRQLVTSGAGPVLGLGGLVGVPPDLADVPVPVGRLDLGRVLPAFSVLAELLKSLGVAHRRIGLQRFPARFQPGALFL